MQKNWLYLIPLTAIIIGCGSTDNTLGNTGEGSIDLRSYLEKENINKNYQSVNKAVGQSLTNQYYEEKTLVSGSKIERSILDILNNVTLIEEKKLTNIDVSEEGNITTTFNRYVDVGDTLFSSDINSTEILKVGTQEVGTQQRLGTNSCNVMEQLTEFNKDSQTYSGDILKIKCSKNTTITTKIKDEFVGNVSYVNGTEDSVDIYYEYLRKDIGSISSINDDCMGIKFPNDSSTCTEEKQSYHYNYYLGN